MIFTLNFLEDLSKEEFFIFYYLIGRQHFCKRQEEIKEYKRLTGNLEKVMYMKKKDNGI